MSLKLIHIADLHLGKKVHGRLMLEDQQHALQQVLDLAREEHCAAILIAGDVYDTSSPIQEAVRLLDWFLSEADAAETAVFMIAGNHDSGTRLAFGQKLLEKSRVYIQGSYQGSVPYFDLEEDGVRVRLHLLPFVRPSSVAAFHPDEPVSGWTEAVSKALSTCSMQEEGKNILLSHQFYAGASQCDSEQVYVGGVDRVAVDVLDAFDYAALGHLHSPQSLGAPHKRYCGTLLKYSTSEISQQKTITLLDIQDDIQIQEIPVKPLHDFVRIQGTLEQLLSPAFAGSQNRSDYFYAVLEDDFEGIDAHARLSQCYPGLLRMEYKPKKARTEQQEETDAGNLQVRRLDPAEIFQTFYQLQNGRELDEEMMAELRAAWEECDDAD